MKQYFDILGIPPTTDKAVIKRAYRKKCLEYHPDMNSSVEAEEYFLAVQTAYEVLSGKPLKRKYAIQTEDKVRTQRESEALQRKERVEAYKRRVLEKEIAAIYFIKNYKYRHLFKMLCYSLYYLITLVKWSIIISCFVLLFMGISEWIILVFIPIVIGLAYLFSNRLRMYKTELDSLFENSP